MTSNLSTRCEWPLIDPLQTKRIPLSCKFEETLMRCHPLGEYVSKCHDSYRLSGIGASMVYQDLP